MHFAEVVVQPRGERVAQDRVEHAQREVVGRGSRHADPADPDLRLRRARLVDQEDLARGELRRVSGHRGLRAGRAFPSGQRLFELRHDRVGGDVAGDDQRRVRRPVLRRVERLEIRGGDRLERRGGADGRGAVAVLRAEHQLAGTRPGSTVPDRPRSRAATPAARREGVSARLPETSGARRRPP